MTQPIRTGLLFILICLLSLLPAFAVAFSFADVFHANDEFALIQLLIVVYSIVAIAAFAVVYAKAKKQRTFGQVAAALAFVAVAIEEIPSFDAAIGSLSTDPYKYGLQRDVEISFELVLPIFIAILIQWRLVLWRWLRLRDEKFRSLWPWYTTILAALVAFNPLGIAILQSAVLQKVTDWFAELSLWTSLIAAGVLVAFGLLEWYFRARMRRTQTAANL